MDTQTISIPVCKFTSFCELAEKIQKKQQKYGLQELKYTEVRRFAIPREKRIHVKGETFRSDTCSYIRVEYIELNIENGGILKRNGADEYRHVGSMTDKDGVIIIHRVSEEHPEWFMDYPSRCDHCGTHRKRNKYHVFERNGHPYYIGSTCAKEYFGIDCAALLDLDIDLFELIDENSNEEHWEQFYEPCITFAQVYHFINKNILTPWSELKDEIESNDWRRESECCNGQDANALYEMVKGHYESMTGYSDFNINCCRVLQYDYCTGNNLRLYACAVYFALKQKRDKESSRPLTKSYNEGDKVTITAKVEGKRKMEQAYFGPVSYLLKFTESDGERYETFASGKIVNEVKVGDTVTLKATIVGRAAFKGVESWRIKRCVLAM